MRSGLNFSEDFQIWISVISLVLTPWGVPLTYVVLPHVSEDSDLPPSLVSQTPWFVPQPSLPLCIPLLSHL